VVDAYQLSLTKVPQDGTGVVESLARLVHHLDSPAISPAVVPMHRVMTAARADGIKVLFDGQGADELLGGYDSHFQPRALHGLARAALAAPDPARLRALAQGLMGLSRRDLAPLARYLLPALHGPYRRLLGIDSALTPELRAVASDPDEQPSRLYTDPLAHALHQAHAYAILPGLLHYGDAVSMASSVECRLPFLDYRLVEFCFRLPASDKIGPDGTKAILRRASQGLLIDKVRCRRWKNGFNTPIRDWLLADPQLPALLGEEAVRRHRVFRPEALCGRAGLARLTTLPQTHLLRWVSTLLWLAVCIG
jgi:asparagine synthase (glutamine-hydrolysing)